MNSPENKDAALPEDAGRTLGDIAKDIITTDPKQDNGTLLAFHELCVMHFRPGFDLPGMTVAYRPAHKGSNVVEIATAITNPCDTFTKKIGTRVAVEAFVKGRTVFIPVMEKKKPITFTLKHYFG